MEFLEGKAQLREPADPAARPEVVTNAIEEIEPQIRGAERERLVILDGLGNEVKRLAGSKIGVELPIALVKDATLVHNHTDGTPPGFDDTEKLFVYGAREIWVTGEEYSYSLRLAKSPTEQAWRDFTRAYNAEKQDASLTIEELEAAGVSQRQAVMEVAHQIWRNLAARSELGVQYERRPYHGK